MKCDPQDAARVAEESGGYVQTSWIEMYDDGKCVLGPWSPARVVSSGSPAGGDDTKA